MPYASLLCLCAIVSIAMMMLDASLNERLNNLETHLATIIKEQANDAEQRSRARIEALSSISTTMESTPLAQPTVPQTCRDYPAKGCVFREWDQAPRFDVLPEPGPSVCDALALHCTYSRALFGHRGTVPAYSEHHLGMYALGWGDIISLSLVWSEIKHLQNIVEFGTAAGVDSLYFGTMCALRGGKAWTLDFKDLRWPEVKAAWPPLEHAEFLQLDLLSDVNERAVHLISQPNTLVLMDNGNKPKEIAMYLRFLHNSSIMATHDWNEEVAMDGPHGIRAALENASFVPYAHALSELLGSHIRVFTSRD